MAQDIKSTKDIIHIGLDLGTTSIGWSIINNDYHILDTGVVLFDDPSSPKDGKSKNAERRELRRIYRTRSRIKARKYDFKKLVVQTFKWVDESTFQQIISTNNNALLLAHKGLTTSLTKPELIKILYNTLAHRWFSYQIDKTNTDINIFNTDESPIKQKVNFFNTNGYIKNSSLNRQIPRTAYNNDLKTILNNANINPKETETILQLFNRQRSFATGPGSITKPTPYGLYQKQGDQIVKVANTIFDKTIGHCSIYPNELRGLKNAPITELFNLCNDLNNLKIDDECLTLMQKSKIIMDINNLKSITYAYLKKIIGSECIISGVKLNQNNEPVFQLLKNTKTIINFLHKHNKLNLKTLNLFNTPTLNLINDIFMVFVKNIEPNLYLAAFNKLITGVSDNEIHILHDSLIGLNTSSSLSYKAMLEFIQHFLTSFDTSSVYFYEQTKANQQTLSHLKYLPSKYFADSYLSPTAKRGLFLTLTLLNSLLKKYTKNYQLGNISIELPRDNNSFIETKRIKQQQTENLQILTKIVKELNLDNITNLSYKTKLKLKLWYSQNKIDPYNLQSIDGLDLIKHPQNYEIDHIIPFEISGDDSMNNKVVTSILNNQNKKERTPYQWFGNNISVYAQFTDYVNNNDNFSTIKKQHLLYDKNPWKEQLGFINRQFVDTSVISKLVLNVLNNFLNNNKYHPYAKVHNIKGVMTNYARYNLFNLPKDRNNYVHHAVDSLIINYLGCNPNLYNKLNSQFFYDKINQIYKKTNPNRISTFSFDNLYKFTDITRKYEDDIKSWVDKEKVKFYHTTTHKTTGAFTNDTLYSIKHIDKNGVNVYNRLDLINSDNTVLNKFFGSEHKHSNLICNQNLWQKLNELYLQNLELMLKNTNIKPTANPFLYDDNTKSLIEKYYIILSDGTKVRKIKKLLYEDKNPDVVHFEKKQFNRSGKLSLQPFNFRIYKNKYNKLVAVSLNIKCLKLKPNSSKVEIVEDKLNTILDKLEVVDKTKYLTITRGTLFRVRDLTNSYMGDKFFYSNGGGTLVHNIIELNCLRINTKKRIFVNSNKLAKDFILVRKEITGEVYKEVDLLEYFK